MTINERHDKTLKELEKRYLGKYIYDKEDNEYKKIIGVNVDYDITKQYMNRVNDEDGTIWFINELDGIVYDSKDNRHD